METPIQANISLAPESSRPLSVQDRIQALRDRRRELMAMPAEDALAAILEERQPVPLVHAFPAEDFYLLVQEIGPDDALELLGMASNRQWEFILDAEAWDGDRIDLGGLTRWLNRFLQAAPDRLVRWAGEEKTELLEYYFYRNVDIAIREEDHDASDFPDDFFSDDQVFFLRLRPDVFGLEAEGEDSEADVADKDERDAFLADFLRRLSREDHVRYQSMLLEAASILPAEMEEELYRRRNVRRAERGFAPLEEAVGVYQGLTADALDARYPKVLRPPEGAPPAAPLGGLDGDDPFSRTLSLPDLSDVIEPLQSEFAGLCNHLIVADRLTVRDRETLREVARKAAGYISIGLEVTSGEISPAKAASAVRRHALVDLFRVGYGEAAALKSRAQRWSAESWAALRGLPLTFWGEDWLGVLGGLLLPRPRYYDDARAGERYREFSSLAEIRRTADRLEHIVRADRLLDLADPLDRAETQAVAEAEGRIIWETVLLNGWARNRLDLPGTLSPIPLSTFRPFFHALWTDDLEGGRLSPDVRSDLVEFLAAETRLETAELLEWGGAVVDALVAFLESELGRVSVRELDPRFVLPFRLS
ncbi:MAG: DUF6178 family protein [Desulfococcaceae bacterium]